MKQDWCFVWDNEKSELTLHDKTKEEAFEIARYFGWRPRVWYRPSTWGNVFRSWI
jgi:hypothetical protein